MDKSPDAFRTISEVAEALETPAHVLRFWESRFPQIRPVKRAGGRRYYRPSDVALLTGIKRLLHDEGLTIRGVQKILREQGIRHVAGLTEDPSAEELALDAAMTGRFDLEIDTSPATVSDATAEALSAALNAGHGRDGADQPSLPFAEADRVVAFPSLAPAAPPAARPMDDSPPDDLMANALVPDDLAPDDLATDDLAPDSAAQPADTAAPAQDWPPKAPPPLPAEPRVHGLPDDLPTATLAARLRALPHGSLSHRRPQLLLIAARIARLRKRLGLPPESARG